MSYGHFVSYLILLVSQFAVAVPKTTIPSPVLQELQELSLNFDALVRDECSSRYCFPKGCRYGDHVSLFPKTNASNPGIPLEPQKLGQKQNFLSRAICDLAYEPSVEQGDIKDLARRMSEKLSVGFVKVNVNIKALAPLSQSLGDLKTPLSAKIMGEQLWQQLLPVTPWLIGLVLGTVAMLLGFWGYRRLGQETIDEKMAYEEWQLQLKRQHQQALQKPEEHKTEEFDETLRRELDNQLTQLSRESHVWQQVLAQWLRAERFDLLRKAGEEAQGYDLALLPEDTSLTREKIAYEQYLKSSKPSLSTREFLKVLHGDVLREKLACSDPALRLCRMTQRLSGFGLAQSLEAMPTSLARIMVAMISVDRLRGITRYFSIEMKEKLAWSLMMSDRACQADLKATESFLSDFLSGKGLRQGAVNNTEVWGEGVSLKVESALSIFLEELPSDRRVDLMEKSLAYHRGTHPPWLQRVFYPDMLRHVPHRTLSHFVVEHNAEDLAQWVKRYCHDEVKNLIYDASPQVVKQMIKGHLPEKSINEDHMREVFSQQLQKHYRQGDMRFEQLVV